MNLEQYLQKKKRLAEEEFQPRENCARCKKSRPTCYCKLVRPFNSTPEFLLLMHMEERRRTVATGRMAHLVLTNSKLIVGCDFTLNSTVNEMLGDPMLAPILIFPSQKATDLSSLSLSERRRLLPPGKRPLFIILDGTWSQARRMKRESQNLEGLPQFQFMPPKPSGFLVRKQPEGICYSTIESIHHLIDLFQLQADSAHHNLIEVFNHMVSQQVHYENRFGANRGYQALRGIRHQVEKR